MFSIFCSGYVSFAFTSVMLWILLVIALKKHPLSCISLSELGVQQYGPCHIVFCLMLDVCIKLYGETNWISSQKVHKDGTFLSLYMLGSVKFLPPLLIGNLVVIT
jgi:hypothetical protein